MRLLWNGLAAIAVACASFSVPGLASAGYPPMPAKARHILERDWCDLSAYDRAARVPGLGRDGKANLSEAKRVVRKHPAGCRLAEGAARRRAETLPPDHAPWTRPGPQGAPCPKGALPLGAGARDAAARAAAAAQGRIARPVIVGVGRSFREGQVTAACGRAALRRSVIVSSSLTGYMPSASLSERVVAVARFPRYGWRVWMILH
jgi:hypothetical protein